MRRATLITRALSAHLERGLANVFGHPRDARSERVLPGLVAFKEHLSGTPELATSSEPLELVVALSS